MAKNYAKNKGRRESGSFISIPKQVLDSPQYAKLSSHAAKLLLDLGVQYNGKNNGDLCATYSLMSKRGWRSSGTLSDAIKLLLDSGFVILARQGRRPKVPSLYALSFKAIDECNGKHDLTPSPVPPNTWKEK